ncbi:MAG: amino acid adenylation domain-containing protein [Gammaproteobacteria bacterium]|jgi:amino acid adenylation domain-containing protein|nr:amino acid adenylation domain-containing protein [Gammaproteobacteria bacterium]
MSKLPLDANGPQDHPFTPFPDSALDGSILDRFRAIADCYASQIAIDDGQRRLTYRALAQWVDRLAGALIQQLPADADPVAIYLDHTAHFPLAMLGVLAAGHAYVPLDVGFPQSRNQHILAHAGLSAIVTDTANAPQAAELLRGGQPLVVLDQLDPIGTQPSDRCTADSLAYILYTSGSSGAPKGVYQNHRNLLHDVLQYTNSIHINPDDRLTQLYSGSVNGAIRDIYGALLNGAALHPLAFRHLGAAGLIDALAARRITLYHSVPTVFRHLIAAMAPDQRLAGIRLAYLAGDRVTHDDVDAFQRHFPRDALLYTGIGSTENATLYRQWFIGRDTPRDGATLPVGRAIPERDMVLLDEHDVPVPVGAVGEIVVTSRYLDLGYWRDPELTRRCFSPSPHDPQARVFRTGDLGRLRPDGLLEFLGRKDHQVKIRGYRVELGAIEAAVREQPGIRDAAFVVREQRSDQQRLDAYVLTDQPRRGSVDHLRQSLRDRLPPHMIPATLTALDAWPLTPNGKLDRAALPLPQLNRATLGTDYIAPRTPTEQALVELWQEVLQLNEPLGIHDDFFALGGHSLLVTQVLGRIVGLFELEISLRAFFAAPTIAALAVRIEQSQWQRVPWPEESVADGSEREELFI